MKLFQTPIRVLGIFLALCAGAAAQQEISVQPAAGGWSFVTSPYRAGSCARHPAGEFLPPRFAHTGGQSLSDRARRGGVGHRKQYRRGNPAIWPVAGAASAPARASRRRAAQCGPGSGRRTPERQFARGQREHVGRRRPERGQRSQFRRRHRHPVGSPYSFFRSNPPRHCQFWTYHLRRRATWCSPIPPYW